MSAPETKMPVETPAEWLRYAKENLEVAERELTYDVPAHHTICFLCQSAAEKYLKGCVAAFELAATPTLRQAQTKRPAAAQALS